MLQPRQQKRVCDAAGQSWSSQNDVSIFPVTVHLPASRLHGCLALSALRLSHTAEAHQSLMSQFLQCALAWRIQW